MLRRAVPKSPVASSVDLPATFGVDDAAFEPVELSVADAVSLIVADIVPLPESMLGEVMPAELDVAEAEAPYVVEAKEHLRTRSLAST